MIELNPTNFKLIPKDHQLRGLRTLLKKPFYGLFWEMRLQKTKVVIDAAQALFEAGELDLVIVVCPAQVKDVWLNSEFGEIAIHSHFLGYHYTARTERYALPGVHYLVTSLEFLRQESRIGRGRSYPKVERLLKELKGKRYWLVADEGSALGNHRSNQWRAVRELRKQATRFTMLDGTPIGNSPMEQYAKFKLIHPDAIGYPTFSAFKTAHAVIKGGRFPQIVGFKDQAVIDARVKDYCEYLEQRDVPELDFPEFVPSVLSVALKPAAWKTYVGLKNDLYAKIDSGEIEVQHAPVAILRLAQVCAGFVGGVETEDNIRLEAQEIGTETLDLLLGWLHVRLHERPNFRCVVWCRWRAEIERLVMMLRDHLYLPYGVCYGGERYQVESLNRRSSLTGPFIMVAQPQAARYGKDWSLADTAVYLSQDYSRTTRSQSEQRVQAENVRKTTMLIDVLVTGPDGQRTVTHDIVRSVRRKEEVARRTAREWKKLLED